MKKKLNTQHDNNQVENLINFLSKHKLLSFIAGKKLFKNITKRPLRVVTIAVAIGCAVSFLFKKNKNKQ